MTKIQNFMILNKGKRIEKYIFINSVKIEICQVIAIWNLMLDIWNLFGIYLEFVILKNLQMVPKQLSTSTYSKHTGFSFLTAEVRQ